MGSCRQAVTVGQWMETNWFCTLRCSAACKTLNICAPFSPGTCCEPGTSRGRPAVRLVFENEIKNPPPAKRFKKFPLYHNPRDRDEPGSSGEYKLATAPLAAAVWSRSGWLYGQHERFRSGRYCQGRDADKSSRSWCHTGPGRLVVAWSGTSR